MIASENFNPRSREGSDRESIGWEALNTISIHAPARGATPSRFHEEYSPYISIHAPARGATHVHVPVLSAYEISIHAPARGATMASVKSPHTAVPISIHAPARGATEDVLGSVYMEGISIHAPARGATSFNSSPTSSISISIHAPARGATGLGLLARSRRTISIHAPARGATLFPVILFSIRLFQSTLPRGERRASCLHRFKDVYISIHAPARGATLLYKDSSQRCGISIHAPARGATSILSKIHPMFLTISHNASSFSSFPFHSFLPHLLNSSTFCALFQVRISRAFSVYYRFAPKKSTPDL